MNSLTKEIIKQKKAEKAKPKNRWVHEVSGMLNDASYTVYGFKNSSTITKDIDGKETLVPLLIFEIIPPH